LKQVWSLNMSFFEELKRRKVFRVAATYAVVAWILMQIGEVTFPALNIPEWVMSTLVVVLLAGFPIAVIFAWIFDKTPQGYIKTDAPNTENIGRMNVKVDDRPFYLQKRNIILALGVLAGILIGTYGGDSFSSVDSKSIAVLPFDNYSTAEEDQYFSDGMTEVIIANLANVKDLKVISRTSVMEYKNTTKKLKEIAKELGVAHILEGSIQRANGRVRVVGQLIDADTDEHIWAETYDRNESDLFELQSSVAIEIAEAMKSELTSDEKARINEVLTESTAAYEYYLKGNMYDNAGHNETNLRAAISEYERAVSLDPTFAEAYAQLGKMHAHIKWYRLDLSPSRMKASKEAIDQAMQLKPNNAIVRMARATYFYHGFRDYAKALADYSIAIELAPGNSFTHFYAAMIYRRLGDLEKSIILNEKALEMDPRSMLIMGNLSRSYRHIRNYEKALSLANQMILINPNNSSNITWDKMNTLFDSGKLNEAKAIAELANMDNNTFQIRLAYMYGNAEEIEKVLREYSGRSFGNLFYFWPKSYFEGIALELNNEIEKSQKKYLSSIEMINEMLKSNPNDPRFHATLGLIYGRLGDKQRAIQSGIKATELLPINRDAILGASYRKELSKIYVLTGSKLNALEEIESLSVLPNGFSYGELLHNPIFDSIRNEPRFKTVLNNLNPKL